jgi:hypothetical protein
MRMRVGDYQVLTIDAVTSLDIIRYRFPQGVVVHQYVVRHYQYGLPALVEKEGLDVEVIVNTDELLSIQGTETSHVCFHGQRDIIVGNGEFHGLLFLQQKNNAETAFGRIMRNLSCFTGRRQRADGLGSTPRRAVRSPGCGG